MSQQDQPLQTTRHDLGARVDELKERLSRKRDQTCSRMSYPSSTTEQATINSAEQPRTSHHASPVTLSSASATFTSSRVSPSLPGAVTPRSVGPSLGDIQALRTSVSSDAGGGAKGEEITLEKESLQATILEQGLMIRNAQLVPRTNDSVSWESARHAVSQPAISGRAMLVGEREKIGAEEPHGTASFDQRRTRCSYHP